MREPTLNDSNSNELADLCARLDALLAGQVINRCVLNSERELLVVFESGDRLFVDAKTALDISVT